MVPMREIQEAFTSLIVEGVTYKALSTNHGSSLIAALVFASVVFISLDSLCPELFTLCGVLKIPLIPVRGEHLDTFESVDYIFIYINKVLTVLFAYHFCRYAVTSPTILWSQNEMTIVNTLVHFIVLTLLYDLGYYTWHRFLHIRVIYPFVHKHHHRQHAPSRGNTDGVNANPIEYIVSAYMHLWVLQLIPGGTHICTAVSFMSVGAIIGSLNHTRLDVRIWSSRSGWPLYKAHDHDIHHRFPENNFGQYSSLWDHILGTYRSYEESILKTAIE